MTILKMTRKPVKIQTKVQQEALEKVRHFDHVLSPCEGPNTVADWHNFGRSQANFNQEVLI